MHRHYKVFLWILVVCIFGMTVSGPTFCGATIVEHPEIKVAVNGKMTTNTNVAITVNNQLFLPLNELLEKMGIPSDDQHVILNDADQTVTILNGESQMTIAIGSTKVTVDGKTIEQDFAPMIYEKNKKVYVSFLIANQVFSKRLEWDDSTRTIVICDEADYKKSEKFEKDASKAMQKLKNYHEVIKRTYKDKFVTTKIVENKTVFPSLKSAHILYTVINLDSKTGKKLNAEKKYEVFYHDLREYKRLLPSGKWVVTTLTKTDYAMELGLASMPPAVIAGRMVTESRNGSEVIGQGCVLNLFEPDFTMKASFKTVCDQKTSQIKSEYATCSGTTPKGIPYTTELTIQYGQFNDRVSFQLPKRFVKH